MNTKKNTCEIVEVGKRRDGGYRFWCLKHRHDATAKYGVAAKKCIAADDAEIPINEIFHLDPNQYQGGIGIWGAVPAIYDTTNQPMDRGIHIHARSIANGEKEIDATYRGVTIPVVRDLVTTETLSIGELDAIYFMVSNVFDKPMKFVKCSRCSYAHLDKDWFSVHAHQRHLCHGCGQKFSDDSPSVGNPVIRLQQLFESGKKRRMVAARKNLSLRQVDFSGGIQIWGSNPAILWTSEKPEESGIHVHAFTNDIDGPVVDDTFSKVNIDGIDLDAAMVRQMMAQAVMPHISHRIQNISCPHCKRAHFDRGDMGFTPHTVHECEYCGGEFPALGRLKLTVGNPQINLNFALAKYAVREPAKYSLGLRPETI